MNSTSRVVAGVAAAMLTVGIAAAPASAATTAPRHFSCTGYANSSKRIYAKQTVTGTLAATNVPTAVSDINYLGAVVIASPAPRLDNLWWSWAGFKTTKHWNQWKLGATATGDTAHLMLPDTTPGGAFTAELVTEFGPNGVNGNWQNVMACTAA